MADPPNEELTEDERRLAALLVERFGSRAARPIARARPRAVDVSDEPADEETTE
jgi:hypothetical protein